MALTPELRQQVIRDLQQPNALRMLVDTSLAKLQDPRIHSQQGLLGFAKDRFVPGQQKAVIIGGGLYTAAVVRRSLERGERIYIPDAHNFIYVDSARFAAMSLRAPANMFRLSSDPYDRSFQDVQRVVMGQITRELHDYLKEEEEAVLRGAYFMRRLYQGSRKTTLH